MKKIGILGGTFDPVHEGHVQLASAAKLEFALDKVLLIPAADPPHKSLAEITPYRHRLAMLKRAVPGTKGLEASDIEARLPTPSYTIDTVRYLQSSGGSLTHYYFIIGVDAFADLLSWKAYAELLQNVTLIVANRKGFFDTNKLVEVALAIGYKMNDKRWIATLEGFYDIVFLQNSPQQVSSTEIREILAAGNTAKGVNSSVLRYIRENGLYKKSAVQSG